MTESELGVAVIIDEGESGSQPTNPIFLPQNMVPAGAHYSGGVYTLSLANDVQYVVIFGANEFSIVVNGTPYYSQGPGSQQIFTAFAPVQLTTMVAGTPLVTAAVYVTAPIIFRSTDAFENRITDAGDYRIVM